MRESVSAHINIFVRFTPKILCGFYPASRRRAPAFDSRGSSPKIKNSPARSRAIFYFCGDGGNRTRVQMVCLKESTKRSQFNFFKKESLERTKSSLPEPVFLKAIVWQLSLLS